MSILMRPLSSGNLLGRQSTSSGHAFLRKIPIKRGKMLYGTKVVEKGYDWQE